MPIKILNAMYTFSVFIIPLSNIFGAEIRTPNRLLVTHGVSRRASSTTPAPFLVDNYTTTLVVPFMVALLITFILYNKSKMSYSTNGIRLVNVTKNGFGDRFCALDNASI